MRKFTLNNDYISFEPLLRGIERDEEYLKISDCMVSIPKGYSWDGCTFTFDFKRTYYASLVHDALYQYKVNRRISDRIFYDMMKQEGFILAWLYYAGTRLFGWMFY